MKSKKNLLDQFKGMPHFSKDSLCQLGKQLGLADATVNTYISRFLKHKEIIQLKRGLYVTTDFFSKNMPDVSYSFYLANIIRTPSYVSSWSALQFYNLTTEAIHSITSVTPKVTRIYKTKAGNFTYQSLKQDLFSDFSLMKGKTFDFFIASPAKALFDLLYFKTHQFRGVRTKDVKALAEELRIDVDEMGKKERSKFYDSIKKRIHDE
jgi:predicted transcriptional regulator of viral defense system